MNLLTVASTQASNNDPGAALLLISLAIAVAVGCLVAQWRMYTKAKQPGWAVLVPFYNWIVYLRIASRPGWWFLLFLIPVVNVIVHLVVALDIAKAFRKSTLFAVFGLWLFAPIGQLILGYGDAKYKHIKR